MVTIQSAARSRSCKAVDVLALGEITDSTLLDLVKVFQLLSDRHRLQMLLALARTGPMNVTQLKNLIDQSQPAVSHHLALMRDAKLVLRDRQGKHNYYSIDASRFGGLLDRLFGELGNSARHIQFEELALTLKRK